MKKVTIMLLAAATMLSCSSCRKVTGEGPVETENRSLISFSGISSNIGCNINFSQAPAYKIEIRAQRNIINLLETYKSGNDLILKFKNKVSIKNYTDITINISSPTLENLLLSGSGNVHVTGNFEATRFNTQISGSGNLSIDHLQVAETLTSGISGSGNIRVMAGMSKAANMVVSGSGSIDLSGVSTNAAIVKIAGSGTAKVNATQALDATIAGSGNIYYFNNPQVNVHISGSGKVVRG
jgi:hypothetical protein